MQALVELTDELFELVIDLDPARAKWEQLSEGMRERAVRLRQKIEQAKQQVAAAAPEAASRQALQAALASASSRLAELGELLKQQRDGQRWRGHYASLARSYEELVQAARRAELPSLRRFRSLSPANHARSVFHMASGLTGALAYHYLLDRTGALLVMGLLAGTFSALELLRRRSARANDRLMSAPFFRHIARAREYYQVNSATYYAWGLLLSVFFFSREVVEAACLVVAFGDPWAAYAGRRFGRRKLYRDKSLVGALCFFTCAALAVLAFRLLVYGSALGPAFALAALSALAGTLAEVFTRGIDDNLSIPLAVGLALSLLG